MLFRSRRGGSGGARIEGDRHTDTVRPPRQDARRVRSARLRCFANCPALAPVDPGLVFGGSTWRAAASPAAPGEESPTARAQLTAAESGDCSGQELSEPGGPGTSGPESRSELLQTFPALFGLAAAAAKKSKAAERGAKRSDARAAPLAPASELDRREPLPPGAPSPSQRKRAQSPGVRAAETRRHCGAPRRAAGEPPKGAQ